MKERIKQLCSYFGLSKEKFANMIGRTKSFIIEIEAGRSGISEKTFQEICTVFGVNDTWLRDGIGPMFKDGMERPVADLDGIAERVKEIRKKAGLTQQQFGDQIGFHKNHIHYVETGKAHPSEDFLNQVADTFNISYDWLMTGTGEMDVTDEALVDD